MICISSVSSFIFRTAFFRMTADHGSMYRSDTLFPKGSMRTESPFLSTISCSARKSTTLEMTLSIPYRSQVAP